jgi:hypothetical protein
MSAALGSEVSQVKALQKNEGDEPLYAPVGSRFKDMRIYNRTLTSGELQMIFDEEKNPISNYLIAWYKFDEGLFSTDGRVIVADYAAARRFAESMSAQRAEPVPASDINAMGLLDEVFHVLIRQYELQNPGVLHRALEWMQTHVGERALESTLLHFNEEFPPLSVYRGEISARK